MPCKMPLRRHADRHRLPEPSNDRVAISDCPTPYSKAEERTYKLHKNEASGSSYSRAWR